MGSVIIQIALAVAMAQRGMPPPGFTHRQILDGIRLVESGGRDDCPDGDGGRAIGPFQIWRVYWQDALEFDPSIGGAYQDCRSRAYAEKVVAAYMRRHVPGAWRRRVAEVIVRTHNGGPHGSSALETRDYWLKVRDVLLGGHVHPIR
jgi:hypothetical protein